MEWPSSVAANLPLVKRWLRTVDPSGRCAVLVALWLSNRFFMCAASSLSETTSKLSCFFLDVFDEPGDVYPVCQRVMEIDEER